MPDSTDQRRTTAPGTPDLPRRTLLRTAGVAGAAAVGAGALAACGSTSDSTRSGSGSGAGSGGSSSAGAASGSSSSAAGGSGGSGGLSVAAADVPVGGGKILDGAVVTQPTKGTFKAFSSMCTHQGCPVTQIQGTNIECMCHGSMFDIATGAVVQGPATQPLAAKTATVQGDKVVVS